MSESVTRFPLSWPLTFKRTPRENRERATFAKGNGVVERGGRIVKLRSQLSIADATERLGTEIERLGGEDAILSTNVKTKLNGLPTANAAEPADTGAAVYFNLEGKPLSLACDKWDRVADNIAALAQHIFALRSIDRYGVGTMQQAFAGYTALPPVGGTQGGDWRLEFGFEQRDHVTLDIAEARYRALLKARHPDNGGTHDAIVRLNLARDSARAYFAEHA